MSWLGSFGSSGSQAPHSDASWDREWCPWDIARSLGCHNRSVSGAGRISTLSRLSMAPFRDTPYRSRLISSNWLLRECPRLVFCWLTRHGWMCESNRIAVYRWGCLDHGTALLDRNGRSNQLDWNKGPPDNLCRSQSWRRVLILGTMEAATHFSGHLQVSGCRIVVFLTVQLHNSWKNCCLTHCPLCRGMSCRAQCTGRSWHISFMTIANKVFKLDTSCIYRVCQQKESARNRNGSPYLSIIEDAICIIGQIAFLMPKIPR